METLNTFIDDIASFDIPVPLWVKEGFIIVLIVGFLISGYFLRDIFDISYMREGFVWYVVIGIINLLCILGIYMYYHHRMNIPGQPGIKGKKGKIGKIGKSVSCDYCKNNIYIMTTSRSDEVCNVFWNRNIPNIKDVIRDVDFFIDKLAKEQNIKYASFINNIILAQPENTNSSIYAVQSSLVINKFRSLLNPHSILIALIHAINSQLISVSSKTLGFFKTPINKVGYLPIGDSVYGGTETYQLNSFLVSGNIMYPSGYNRLITFQSFDTETNAFQNYTLWRPVPQTVKDTTFEGETEKHQYLPLGDICRIGESRPLISDYAIIKDTCLDEVKSLDLKMTFIYYGYTEYNKEVGDTASPAVSSQIDYTKDESYLIENAPKNYIEIFSVWKTPMNTFITNSNYDNEFTNNTVYFNIYNNVNDAISDYGAVKLEYKKAMRFKLESIKIPQIICGMIYVQHFLIENTQEMMYYINKYLTAIPELYSKFSTNLASKQLYEMMNAIVEIKKTYDDYNKELVRDASISLRSDNPIMYDEKGEKHLPKKLLSVYETIRNKLDTLPVLIANSNSLLDIVNTIIPNGLDGRIAIDSDGIAEGGILMNQIQETVLRVCKTLAPPVMRAYTIKDECLGTFNIDRDREYLVEQLRDIKAQYDKLIDTISSNYDKYKSQMVSINQYEQLAMKKIGELCGHIPEYMDKVRKLNLDEFTTSRIKGLIGIYTEVNKYLTVVVNTS